VSQPGPPLKDQLDLDAGACEPATDLVVDGQRPIVDLSAPSGTEGSPWRADETQNRDRLDPHKLLVGNKSLKKVKVTTAGDEELPGKLQEDDDWR
jgi:hypothetical protein